MIEYLCEVVKLREFIWKL